MAVIKYGSADTVTGVAFRRKESSAPVCHYDFPLVTLEELKKLNSPLNDTNFSRKQEGSICMVNVTVGSVSGIPDAETYPLRLAIAQGSNKNSGWIITQSSLRVSPHDVSRAAYKDAITGDKQGHVLAPFIFDEPPPIFHPEELLDKDSAANNKAISGKQYGALALVLHNDINKGTQLIPVLASGEAAVDPWWAMSYQTTIVPNNL